MSAIFLKNPCNDDVWKGVAATTSILAIVVTAVAIFTLAKTAGQPSILLYRQPAMITFFVLDVVLIVTTVISISHIFRSKTTETVEEKPRKSQTFPKTVSLLSTNASESNHATTDQIASPTLSVEPSAPSSEPHAKDPTPATVVETPTPNPVQAVVDEKSDVIPKVDFNNVVAIPLLNALQKVMIEWATAAFRSYYFKNENQKELEERLQALDFSFKEFKKIGAGLIKDPMTLDPKVLSQKQKELVAIFILGIDFQNFKNMLKWEEEQITPIFCEELIVFLNRFLFVVNKPHPFDKVEYDKFPEGSKQHLESAVPGLNNSSFDAVLSGIKLKLRGEEQKITLELFKAFQYPFYYSFSTSWRGMSKFREGFKKITQAHVTALVNQLKTLKDSPKLHFVKIVSTFEAACKGYAEALKKLRTKCE